MYNESYQHLRNRTALENTWIDFWECDFVAPGTLASKRCCYEQLLTAVVGSTGITMFWSYELTYLFRWFLYAGVVPRLSRQFRSTKTPSPRRGFGPHPSHMTELALGLSFAIEYPLIVAFNPWTQCNGVDYSVPPLRPDETTTQLIIFLVVEEILKSQIIWFFPPCAELEGKHSLNGPHSAACGLSIDYLLPKATLWFAIMAIWMVYALAGLTGKLQMFPIILWLVVRQFWGRSFFFSPIAFH